MNSYSTSLRRLIPIDRLLLSGLILTRPLSHDSHDSSNSYFFSPANWAQSGSSLYRPIDISGRGIDINHRVDCTWLEVVDARCKPIVRRRAGAGRETTVVEIALEGAFGLIRCKSERRTRAGRHGRRFPRDAGIRRGGVDIPRIDCRRRIDIACRVDRTHTESVFAGRQVGIGRGVGARGERRVSRRH